MIKEQPTSNLNNFLSSYTLLDSTTLFKQLYDQAIIGTNHIVLHEKEKEQILDFLEGLEELNGTVNDLYRTCSEQEA